MGIHRTSPSFKSAPVLERNQHSCEGDILSLHAGRSLAWPIEAQPRWLGGHVRSELQCDRVTQIVQISDIIMGGGVRESVQTKHFGRKVVESPVPVSRKWCMLSVFCS